MLPALETPPFDDLIVLRRGGRKGPCAGYPGEGREHEKHHMQPVRSVRRARGRDRYSGPPDRYAEQRKRWEQVTDGFVCSMCLNAFEPTPCCEREVYAHYASHPTTCGNRASRREVGILSSMSPIARHGETEAEHNYCGSHSPSAHRKRRDAVTARRATQKAEYDARYAKRNTVGRAKAVLLAETIHWRDDEAETEGFCDVDDPCEHHECRLNRAVDAYERAMAMDD